MIRRWLIALVAVLALSVNVGCAAAPESDLWLVCPQGCYVHRGGCPDHELGTVVESEPELPHCSADVAAQPEPEACGMVFSPVPELLEATELAAARWSAATGCDVRVGEGGVPVVYVDPVADGLVGIGGNGENASGGVYRYEETGACAQIGQVIEHSTAQTVAHEIGHCIGQPGHTEDGLMSPFAKGALNAASLERVCDVFPCAWFNPEG